MHGNTINIQIIPLRGCMDHIFLWYGISYATCGIVTRGIITRGTAHACNSQEWNMCRHKHAINVHYSSAILINLQKHIKFSPQL